MIKLKKYLPILSFLLGFTFLYSYWHPLLKLHLSDEYIWKHWLSDYTIYLQMAEDIINFKSFPFYYYGQNYMGPLTSVFIVAWQMILNLLNFKTEIPFFGGNYLVTPTAGVLAPFSMILIGIALWGWAIKRIYHPLAVLLFLILGFTHGYMQMFLFRPNGPEMIFLLSGLIFLIYSLYEYKPSNSRQFILGFVSSLSLWMNQSTIFLILAIALSHFLEKQMLQKALPYLKLESRLNFKHYNLNFYLRWLLSFQQFILIINIFIGLLVLIPGDVDIQISTMRFKMNNGLSPIVTSLLILIILHTSLEFLYYKNSLFKLIDYFRPLRFFIFGFLLIQITLFLAKITGHIERHYSVKIKPVALLNLPEYFFNLLTDFFPRFFDGGFIGNGVFSNPEKIKISFLGYVIFGLFLLLILLFKKTFLSKHSPTRVILLALLFNFVFILFVDRARTEYADRYLAFIQILVPLIICISFIYAKNNLQKFIPLLLLILISFRWLPAGYARMYTYQTDTSALHDELMKLKDSGYKICFADYWDAYRLEYFTGSNVLFIPYKSQDRTPKKSLELKKSTMKKCLYSKNEALVEAPEELSMSP